MPGLDGERSAQIRPREHPPARPRDGRVEDELSEAAIRAMEEGRADHTAGRTFTMAEIRRELGIGPCGAPTSRTWAGPRFGAHDE